MNYSEALEYIHSISWCFCKPGLERTKELLFRLGNPEKSLKFIHVAGTNGKGSFCSMISSVLKDAGYRVGTYTSPYITCFNERMMVDLEMIEDSDLVRITEKIKPIADTMEEKPTEFELVTAIAMEYFKEKKCDLVVLECGLGGRLDSTNVVENVLLSVITTISLDHTSILGDTVEKIAFEKAGIIKSGTPCLFCSDNEKAYRVISEVANERRAPLHTPDYSALEIKKADIEGTVFTYNWYKDVKISLLGSYQARNATNVLCAIDILRSNGLDISDECVRSGLLGARWRARFERILDTPTVIFDGGHNPEGVVSTVSSVKDYFGKEKLLVLSGVMADKDYTFIASEISKIAECVYCITPDNPRALSCHRYREVYEGMGVSSFSSEDKEELIISMLERAKRENKAVLCLGSLYMYSEIVQIVNNAIKS